MNTNEISVDEADLCSFGIICEHSCPSILTKQICDNSILFVKIRV